MHRSVVHITCKLFFGIIHLIVIAQQYTESQFIREILKLMTYL